VTYFFETYGCQMNSAESTALALTLQERGWTSAADSEGADLIIINTCSVRATAETRVLGRLALYEARKKGAAPPFTLIVAGCMASRMGETLKHTYTAVDYVMGTSSRALFPQMLAAIETRSAFVPDAEKPAFTFASSHLESGQRRAFIPIMNGCNNFCSYCIVPYVRGPELSRNPASIMEEIRLVAERGVREITLLGQNVNAYRWEGDGAALDFPLLLERVAEETGNTAIRWVRFLSSHPKNLSPRAIAVMAAHPVFCRHLHLCVQHGSNAMLSAMNRRYTREGYLELVAELRAAMPDITLSTDILVGFPGETEADVAATLDLMEKVYFLYAYIYHYNKREGTVACTLPNQVDEGVKRERLARVMALQRQHSDVLLRSRLGQRAKVLIEGASRRNADELISRTEHDEMVVAPAGTQASPGSFAEVTLSSLRGATFRAKEFFL
jgi:tRNA-2-methylthio-N6-dimethylallyladenosine synthase